MLTDNQDFALIVLTKLISAASLIFLIFLCFIKLKYTVNANFATEIIIILLCFESLYCIGVLLPTDFNSSGSILCDVQAFLIVLGNSNVLIWITCIGHTLWRSIKDSNELDCNSLRKYYIIAICLSTTLYTIL